MLILMKIYRFVISQFRVKNAREVFFLLLKLMATMIILGKIYTNLLCLGYVTEKGDSKMFACYLAWEWLVPAVLIYLIYQGVRFCRKYEIRRHVIIIFVILNIISLWICGSVLVIFYWDAPYWGRVVDEDTGEPVEGACVVGNWHFEWIIGPVFGIDFADAREAVTGKNGYFFLPPARSVFTVPIFKIRLTKLTVFKPGFDKYARKSRKFVPVIIRLGKAETAEARRKALPGIGNISHCSRYKVRKMIEFINKEERELYGTENGEY